MDLLTPFGPMIGVGNLTDEDFIPLKNDIFKALGDTNKESHGPYLVGNIAEEIYFDLSRYEHQYLLLIDIVFDYITSVYKKANVPVSKELIDINIVTAWIVNQKKNEYNPVHTHGSEISGIIYIDIPKEMTNIVSKLTYHKNKDYVNVSRAGELDFINDSNRIDHELSQGTFSVKPVAGNFFIFPGRLNHVVYPFTSDGSRISMSFNANVHNHQLRNKFVPISEET